MPDLSISSLVQQIAELGTTQVYDYVSGSGKVRIVEIVSPEGPIICERWNRHGDKSRANVTTGQLATLASVCSRKPNYPIHVDRLFSAGGNTRSVLETLVAHTPHFFICYPKRVDTYTGEILTNLKHVMWCPDETHDLGQIAEKTYEDLIAELELEIGFGQIDIKPQDLTEEFVSIEAKRIHTQIQIALVEIGVALGFRIWIATNDRSIPVGRLTLGELPGVISSLDDIGILYNQRIKRYAEYIDCIWFKQIEEDSYIIPAIIEIEHSTGVQPGLTRMLKLREVLGSISPKYVIVAPDDQRHRAVSLANDPVSRNLKAEYMPYSTVRVLYGLVKRFKLTNVVDYNFINPFLEHIVE